MIVPRLRVARTTWERMRGLLGRDSLEADEGLLIERCSSIHTWFMRFPIDVAYLDGAWRIAELVRRLRPWRLSVSRRGCCVVELPAGAIDRLGLTPGQGLYVESGEGA